MSEEIMKKKWLAFYAADYEFDTFETREKAEQWLQDLYCNSDWGIPEETMNGADYIAEIKAFSSYEITDEKENYHEHTVDCPDDCIEEEWPYSDEFEHVGKVVFKEK